VDRSRHGVAFRRGRPLFLYDTVKIFLLLAVMIFAIGLLRHLATRAKAQGLDGQRRRLGQYL